jgi:hypothetical protein
MMNGTIRVARHLHVSHFEHQQDPNSEEFGNAHSSCMLMSRPKEANSCMDSVDEKSKAWRRKARGAFFYWTEPIRRFVGRGINTRIAATPVLNASLVAGVKTAISSAIGLGGNSISSDSVVVASPISIVAAKRLRSSSQIMKYDGEFAAPNIVPTGMSRWFPKLVRKLEQYQDGDATTERLLRYRQQQ